MCEALLAWPIGLNFGTYGNDPPESCQVQSVAMSVTALNRCRQTDFLSGHKQPDFLYRCFERDKKPPVLS